MGIQRLVSLRAWATVGLASLLVAAPMTASLAERKAIVKMCVDGKQTQDPNSPACVPYFEGSNGGATWRGVTADEVKVVIQLSTAITNDSNGLSESPPAGTVCDVDILDCDGDGRTDPEAHPWLRVANAYSRYFNARFQTYDRHVRTYIYWSNSSTEAGRRADASFIANELAPFAVMNQASFGGLHEAYAAALATRNTMVFGNLENSPRAFFGDHSPYLWNWWPDAEAHADQYISYVCSKVAGTPVSGGEFAGEERRYGLYRSSDSSSPGDQHLGQLVKEGIEKCGIEIEPDADRTFPYSGWGIDTAGDRTYPAINIASMQEAGVNTILWAGGTETDTSKFADLALYSPEWIVSGDGSMEALSYGRRQGQVSWSNAWTISARPRVGDHTQDPAYQAYREAEPDGEDAGWASDFYTDWMLMFTAFQSAGPGLTPHAVESGLRALAPRESTSPYTVSGSFPAGHFTYVKDANEGWWDPAGIAPDGESGCYRLVEHGKRYPADGWASATGAGLGSLGYERNIERDPCNGYDRSLSIRPGIPSIPLPVALGARAWPTG